METFHGYYKPTKTTEFLSNINKFFYIFGLPNFWVEDFDYSTILTKIFNLLSTFGNLAIFVMVLAEYCAYFTQKNLTERQRSDLFFFMLSHTIISGFCMRVHQQKDQIRDVMYKLGIGLKEVYNDSEIEQQMIKRSKFFSAALTINCVVSVLMYTMEAVLRVIRERVTYNTIITGWPDVEDTSAVANIGRAVFYIAWWIYLSRTCAVYSLVICLTIAASYQCKNLNSYFYNINEIFNDDNDATQSVKEEEYEKAFKVGIKLHSETLKCTNEIQTICRDVFSGQIIFNLILLIILMYQFVNSARNMTNTMTILVAALSILFSTGFFMWNAGDITVEAENLPTAMFCSGWENCTRQSSVRIRNLVVIAMMQAQQPVVMTGLGIITLSYQSYVSIVKSSYSVFSVLY